MTLAEPERDPIGRVEVGMTVRDSEGEHVGVVSQAKLGDPAAVTEQGQDMPAGPLDLIAESIGEGEPNMPDQYARQMTRTGYVKIDAHGWFARDLYARPDEIAEVSCHEVRLSVPGDRLVTER